MSRQSRTVREQRMLQEMLQISSPDNNPDMMLALPDGTLISQQDETTLSSTFSLLVSLGETPAKHRKQLHVDASSLLLAVASKRKNVPPNLAEMSQRYSLSVDGELFSEIALTYANFCLSLDRNMVSFRPVRTSVAPEKDQVQSQASTR